MEKEAWRLLRSLSAKIPSVRIPIASLSGGQRQTVAIARSLVGAPKVVMLDEPTAALGVAQTAEVLNLIERLRESGLGVILISHNMADVQAVADRIVVMRLGRNAAEFRVEEATTAQLVAAITGASDNVVAARTARTAQAADRREPRMSEVKDPDAEATSAVAADMADERLILSKGPAGICAPGLEPAQGRRARHAARDRRSDRDLRGVLRAGAGVPLLAQPGDADPVRGADRASSRSASCWCCCSARSTCRSARWRASPPRSWR